MNCKICGPNFIGKCAHGRDPESLKLYELLNRADPTNLRDQVQSQEKQIQSLKQQLADSQKVNRYLRSSLNRLYGEVSNGEHLDKEWVMDTLREEPKCNVITLLNKENSKIKQQLAESEMVIDFYANEDNWYLGNANRYWESCISDKDCEDEGSIETCGGKRAREYKSKYKVGEK